VPGSENGWLLVRDAVKLPLPEGAPFPGAILEKKSTAPEHEEALAGMVEAAAEHEVHEQVDAEHQAELLKTQQAGAETEAEAEAAAAEDNTIEGESGSVESKES
jgi:large subunit ribosomal protein L3